MADETSLKCREDILRKILQKIEDWQRSFEAKLEEKFEGSNDKIEDDRNLFVRIHLEYYLISSGVMSQVFSRFGELESIERLDQRSQFHWRIQFRNRDSAFKASESYNGRCIYDDCCRMELILGGWNSALVEEKSRIDETNNFVQKLEQGNNEHAKNSEPVEIAQSQSSCPLQTSDGTLDMGVAYNGKEVENIDGEPTSVAKETGKQIYHLERSFKEDARQVLDGMSNDRVMKHSGLNFSCLKVIPVLNETMDFDVESKRIDELVDASMDGIEIGNQRNPLDEHHLFDEYSIKEIGLNQFPGANPDLGSQELDRNIIGKPPEEDNWNPRDQRLPTKGNSCFFKLEFPIFIGCKRRTWMCSSELCLGFGEMEVKKFSKHEIHDGTQWCCGKILMTKPDIPWRKLKEAIWKPGDSSCSSLDVKIGGIEQTVSYQSREMLLSVHIPDVVAELLSGFRDSFGLYSSEFLVIPVAHKVLVERTSYALMERESVVMSQGVDSSSVIDVIMNKNSLWAGNLVFDPGVPNMHLSMGSTTIFILSAERDVISVSSLGVVLRGMIVFNAFFKPTGSTSLFVFDPGGRDYSCWFFQILCLLSNLLSVMLMMQHEEGTRYGAIERLTVLALGVAMDSEWAVLLVGTNQTTMLIGVNMEKNFLGSGFLQQSTLICVDMNNDIIFLDIGEQAHKFLMQFENPRVASITVSLKKK